MKVDNHFQCTDMTNLNQRTIEQMHLSFIEQLSIAFNNHGLAQVAKIEGLVT